MTIGLENIRIVLVGTTHPGNIGAAARAMKNMGLNKLYLVDTKVFPHADATVRAAGADDILEHAVVVDNLDAAIKDCSLVCGTSARLRTLPLELVSPKKCAEIVLDVAVKDAVAIVFGREKTGLTNDELLKCQYHVNIPTVEGFSSLNLAAAVQVLVYELRAASLMSDTDIKTRKYTKLAKADEMELFFEHLEKVLIEIDFLDAKNPRHLMRRLRRLFNRIHIETTELNILRGILTTVQKHKQHG